MKAITVNMNPGKVIFNPQSTHKIIYHMVPQDFVPAQLMKGAGKTISELLWIAVAIRS